MPFRSKAQRKKCYAMKDPSWDCSKWESETKKNQLPERIGKKKGVSSKTPPSRP